MYKRLSRLYIICSCVFLWCWWGVIWLQTAGSLSCCISIYSINWHFTFIWLLSELLGHCRGNPVSFLRRRGFCIAYGKHGIVRRVPTEQRRQLRRGPKCNCCDDAFGKIHAPKRSPWLLQLRRRWPWHGLRFQGKSSTRWYECPCSINQATHERYQTEFLTGLLCIRNNYEILRHRNWKTKIIPN